MPEDIEDKISFKNTAYVSYDEHTDPIPSNEVVLTDPLVDDNSSSNPQVYHNNPNSTNTSNTSSSNKPNSSTTSTKTTSTTSTNKLANNSIPSSNQLASNTLNNPVSTTTTTASPKTGIEDSVLPFLFGFIVIAVLVIFTRFYFRVKKTKVRGHEGKK